MRTFAIDNSILDEWIELYKCKVRKSTMQVATLLRDLASNRACCLKIIPRNYKTCFDEESTLIVWLRKLESRSNSQSENRLLFTLLIWLSILLIMMLLTWKKCFSNFFMDYWKSCWFMNTFQRHRNHAWFSRSTKSPSILAFDRYRPQQIWGASKYYSIFDHHVPASQSLPTKTRWRLTLPQSLLAQDAYSLGPEGAMVCGCMAVRAYRHRPRHMTVATRRDIMATRTYDFDVRAWRFGGTGSTVPRESTICAGTDTYHRYGRLDLAPNVFHNHSACDLLSLGIWKWIETPTSKVVVSKIADSDDS